tara:strand:- start:42 stop:506 length:465 start_codon:yes stop_codon:yes gene_type:complete
MFENLFNNFGQEKVQINPDRLRFRLSNFFRNIVQNKNVKKLWDENLFSHRNRCKNLDEFEAMLLDFFFVYEETSYIVYRSSTDDERPFNLSERKNIKKLFYKRSNNSLDRWTKVDDSFSIQEMWQKQVTALGGLHFLSQPGTRVISPWEEDFDD